MDLVGLIGFGDACHPAFATVMPLTVGYSWRDMQGSSVDEHFLQTWRVALILGS
jgi:hypothetical protein